VGLAENSSLPAGTETTASATTLCSSIIGNDPSSTSSSTSPGQLVAHQLPFAYEQFGDLAWVC